MLDKNIVDKMIEELNSNDIYQQRNKYNNR